MYLARFSPKDFSNCLSGGAIYLANDFYYPATDDWKDVLHKAITLEYPVRCGVYHTEKSLTGGLAETLDQIYVSFEVHDDVATLSEYPIIIFPPQDKIISLDFTARNSLRNRVATGGTVFVMIDHVGDQALDLVKEVFGQKFITGQCRMSSSAESSESNFANVRVPIVLKSFLKFYFAHSVFFIRDPNF